MIYSIFFDIKFFWQVPYFYEQYSYFLYHLVSLFLERDNVKEVLQKHREIVFLEIGNVRYKKNK